MPENRVTPYLWSNLRTVICVHSSIIYIPIVRENPLIKSIQMVFHKIIPACEYRRVKSICLPSPNFVRQLTSRFSKPYRYFLYLQYGVVGYACFHHFAGYKIKVSPSFSVQFSPRYSPWSRWSAPSSKGQWALFTLFRGFSIGTAYWLLIYQSLGLLANEFTFPTLLGVSRCDTYEPRYKAASTRQTTHFAHILRIYCSYLVLVIFSWYGQYLNMNVWKNYVLNHGERFYSHQNASVMFPVSQKWVNAFGTIWPFWRHFGEVCAASDNTP